MEEKFKAFGRNTVVPVQMGMLAACGAGIWFVAGFIHEIRDDVKDSKECIEDLQRESLRDLEQVQRTLDKSVQQQWSVEMEEYSWEEFKSRNDSLIVPDVKKIKKRLTN